MSPAEEFRRHADECRKIAKSTVGLEEKTAWNRIADRWLRCAEQAEREDAAANTMTRARTIRYRARRFGQSAA
jgi:hypothetical protein